MTARSLDSRGHRLLVAEGTADGHDPLAHRDVVGIADLDGGELGALGVLETNDRQVAGLVRADELRLVAVAVVGVHHERGRTLDDVMVREDIAVCVQNHATADTTGVLILALGGDGHDGGPKSRHCRYRRSSHPRPGR